MKFLLILFLSFITFQEVQGATWKKISFKGGTVGTAGTALEPTQCPSGYILVPKLLHYTASDFCVMKFEAKQDIYGAIESVATGTPLTNITRAAARLKCQNRGAGYDLISNDQWQTIARNIAGVPKNWSTGSASSGELNRGHSDNDPADKLDASIYDDSGNCSGTNQTCSSTTWHIQRRTHELSNGSIIWDFSGNVWEWVTNDAEAAHGADDYLSKISGDIRETRYGPAAGVKCDISSNSTPFCGMGHGTFGVAAGAVIRGGHFNDLVDKAGVFSTSLAKTSGASEAIIGFRCVYLP